MLIRPTSDEKLLRTLFRLAVSSSLKVFKNGPRKLPLFFRTCFNFTCLLVQEIPRRPVILPFSLKFPYGRESAAHLVVSTFFHYPDITPIYTLYSLYNPYIIPLPQSTIALMDLPRPKLTCKAKRGAYAAYCLFTSGSRRGSLLLCYPSQLRFLVQPTCCARGGAGEPLMPLIPFRKHKAPHLPNHLFAQHAEYTIKGY